MGSPRRILIVDDDADVAWTFSYVLGELGHVIETAFDAPSAIDAAVRFSPEVVVLDIDLPGIDGYELATRLRRLGPPLTTLRFVAVTGLSQDYYRRRSVDAGFAAHLVKPVRIDQLAAAVRL
ncbi:MAG TPA: response regulator [Polyangia bacterium]|nr:response regulator [Polyangia bacterium]